MIQKSTWRPLKGEINHSLWLNPVVPHNKMQNNNFYFYFWIRLYHTNLLANPVVFHKSIESRSGVFCLGIQDLGFGGWLVLGLFRVQGIVGGIFSGAPCPVFFTRWLLVCPYGVYVHICSHMFTSRMQGLFVSDFGRWVYLFVQDFRWLIRV